MINRSGLLFLFFVGISASFSARAVDIKLILDSTPNHHVIHRDPLGNPTKVDNRSIPAFAAKESGPLEKGFELVRNRFLDPKILQCAKDNVKVFYFEGCVGLPKDFTKEQALAFIDMQFAGLNAKGVPQVLAKRYAKKGADDIATGEAEIGQIVNIQEDAKTGSYTIKGSYTAQMSPEYAASASSDFEIGQIAGTFAHEMLHNMCHSHNNLKTHPDAYTDGNFTTVFGDCVASNGDYQPRAPADLNVVPGYYWYPR